MLPSLNVISPCTFCTHATPFHHSPTLTVIHSLLLSWSGSHQTCQTQLKKPQYNTSQSHLTSKCAPILICFFPSSEAFQSRSSVLKSKFSIFFVFECCTEIPLIFLYAFSSLRFLTTHLFQSSLASSFKCEATFNAGRKINSSLVQNWRNFKDHRPFYSNSHACFHVFWLNCASDRGALTFFLIESLLWGIFFSEVSLQVFDCP